MKNIVIKATPLHNVTGRVDYISNPKRQENLLAFSDTTAPNFWHDLAEHSQQQAGYNPGKKVCEAREMMLALPNVYSQVDPKVLADFLRQDFENRHGVSCAVAIHWNQKKNNLHAHIIFSERKLLENVEQNLATRNTYFDSQGKRSTKTACTDENGELLKGCRFVKKGEDLNRKQFSKKYNYFADKSFMQSEKEYYASMLSRMIDKLAKESVIELPENYEPLKVYDRDFDIELPMTNLKKGEPAEIREAKIKVNESKQEYNNAVNDLVRLQKATREEIIAQNDEILSEAQKSNSGALEYLLRLRRLIDAALERTKQQIKATFSSLEELINRARRTEQPHPDRARERNIDHEDR